MDKTIYALGFFDGVHIGHQALLRACRNLAKEHGTRTGVVTFANHPDALVFGAAPGLINTPEDRELLLTVDYAMDTVMRHLILTLLASAAAFHASAQDRLEF